MDEGSLQHLKTYKPKDLKNRLKPLSQSQIAELNKYKEERDEVVAKIQEYKDHIAQLQKRIEMESDPAKRQSLESEIRRTLFRIRIQNDLAICAETGFALLLNTFQLDGRLYILIEKNTWPNVRIHLPTLEDIESMRIKRLQKSQESADDGGDDL